MAPLRAPLALVRSLGGLDGKIKRWLVKADQHLKWEEFDKAIPYLEGAIASTRVFPALQIILWELLGNAHIAVGASKMVSVCHFHHLAHSRAQGDLRGVARAECNLGIAYMQLSLFKLAGRCFLQYLKHSRSLQDECGVESACSNLGLLSKTLALQHYRASLERGDQETALACLTTCLRRAIIFFKQHLEVVLAHGEIEKEGRAYGNIGSCYELLKDYPEAIFYHKKRLEVVRAIGDMNSELCTLCNLGNCFRAKGDLPQALEHYQMNLEMAQTLGDEGMEELIHHNFAITYELLNQPDDAISSYTLFLGMVVQREDTRKQVEGFSSLARLYLQTGQLTKAHEYTLHLVGVVKKLGDHASLISAQRQLKAIAQRMKREKRQRKRRGSHTPSKQGRVRAHTVSRASNLHHEVAGHTPLATPSRPQLLQYSTGTWSVGRRPHPPLTSVTSEELGPDPILAMADVTPSWEGQVGAELGGSLGYTVPPPTRMHHWAYERSHDLHSVSHDPKLTSPPRQHSRSLGSVTSCSSGSYDRLTPPLTPQGHTRQVGSTHHHTHPLHISRHYTPCSEVLYSRSERRGDGYELVDPPLNTSTADLSSTGRSTALPPLSYSSSLTPSPSEGCGHSQEEGEEDHLLELQRAGLELARAGLELAGYEGGRELGEELGVEEGTDKEWEQWQQINEDQRGTLFGSLVSMSGTRAAARGSNSHRLNQQRLRNRLRTTSAPDL